MSINLSSCQIGAGTLGSAKKWKFNCSRGDLLQSIEELAPSFSCDGVEQDKELWNSTGYDFLKPQIVCLNDYKVMISLVKESIEDDLTTSPSFLSIRAIHDNEGWKPVSDCSPELISETDHLLLEIVLKKLDAICPLEELPSE